MKQQFLEDKVGTLSLTVYSDNVAVIPTSAAVVLYKNDGSVLQASAAATVNSTTGEMTYDLTAVHTADTGLNYKAAWAYVSGGVTYYENQLFDVVKSILSIPITDDDLYAELDSLRKIANQVSATATGGSTTTVVDTKRKEADSFWKGGVIEVIAGTGAGQTRPITAFVQSTGTFTVSPAFSVTIDTTSVYRAVRSFTGKIKQSFEKIEDMLYNAGKRQDLILESSQIKFILIYLTVHFIAIDASDELDDKWDILAKSYWQKFQDAYSSLKLEYDTNETGNIEGGEEQGNSPFELRIGRS